MKAKFLLPLFLLMTSVAHADRPPNVVFVFSDDHAAHAISAYGSNLNQTPHIDRLATEGALFRANYCANSICSPSRATVLTGQHSHLNGVTTWQEFDGSRDTFPKRFQAAGYTTGIFGKWHLKSEPTGFDEWKVYPGQGHYYNPDYRTPEGRIRVTGYSVETTTDMALDFMQRHQEKPFMLFCWYKAPHRTWMPGPAYHDRIPKAPPPPDTLFDDYAGRTPEAPKHRMGMEHLIPHYDLKVPVDGKTVFDRNRMTPEQGRLWDEAYAEENAAYMAAPPQGREKILWNYRRYITDYLKCVAAVDDGVGRLLDELERLGLAENTLVVYSSDQGFFLGDHGWFDKRWMYEESFKMPLLMRWPGMIEPGTQVEQLTQNIDFAPTFLEAAGLEIPESIQGRSLMPLVREENIPWRDALYYEYHDHIGEHRVPRHYGIRSERYKLIHYPETGDWELFDLVKDPEELQSVAEQPAYADVRRNLEQRLRELKAEYRVPELPAD